VLGFPAKRTPMTDFSTCDLCDRLKAGLLTAGDDAFRVLPPVFHSYGGRSRFSGPVLTVKCFEDNSVLKALVEADGRIETAAGRVGQVLVVDGGGSLRRALLGGKLAAAAAYNGWAGLVVDGAVRDVAELAVADVGIRALAPIPLPTDRRGEGQRGLPVQIQGVWVRSGDWLYADADGIVVLPAPAA